MATRKRSTSKGNRRKSEASELVKETTTSQEAKASKKVSSKAKATKQSPPKRGRGRPRVSNADTVRVTLRVDQDQMAVIDTLVRLKQYANRSDAMRAAIAQFTDDAVEDVDELTAKQQKRLKLMKLGALSEQMDELSGA